jgi:hypothetical protein
MRMTYLEIISDVFGELQLEALSLRSDVNRIKSLKEKSSRWTLCQKCEGGGKLNNTISNAIE